MKAQEEVLNELVTGQPSHPETITEEELNHNTNIETFIQNDETCYYFSVMTYKLNFKTNF